MLREIVAIEDKSDGYSLTRAQHAEMGFVDDDRSYVAPDVRFGIGDGAEHAEAPARYFRLSERCVGVISPPSLLERAWGTMLKSIDRLGPEWTQAALRVQRSGWED